MVHIEVLAQLSLVKLVNVVHIVHDADPRVVPAQTNRCRLVGLWPSLKVLLVRDDLRGAGLSP